MIRFSFAIASLAVVATFSVASDPCPTCANSIRNPQAPKPTCDHKIYPLSELSYIRRYCGPVISPNATYGYFQPQWRAWDGQQTMAGCSAPGTTAASPSDTKTENKPDSVPSTPPANVDVPKPVNPMLIPGKETAPKPADKGKTGLNPVGGLLPPQPVSPGVYLVPANSK